MSGRIWIKRQKKPYAFKMRDDAPFAFAGLWDAWKEPGGEWLQSYSFSSAVVSSAASTISSSDSCTFSSPFEK